MQTNFIQRTILHVDANNFFASVETINNEDLKNKPVAVTGNIEKRTGIILAKNEMAKKYKVQTGETIWQAKIKCPNLICLPPHHSLYEKYSYKLKNIYKEYTNIIEPFGIDECWLDITNSQHLFGGADKIATEIRNRTKTELGLTVSVGISFCKLFAKLASDMKKPDATTILSVEDIPKRVYPLEISEIVGIGSKLKKRFNQFNIFKLGQIIEIPDEILKNKFGIIGLQLKKTLLCEDSTPVDTTNKMPKSVGNGTTTTIDIFTEKEIKEVVIFLCEKISERLRFQGLYCASIHISIKNKFLKTVGKNMSLETPTNSKNELVKNAMNLINNFWKYEEKIRAIRISCSNISEQQIQQLSLFDKTTKGDLDNALDKIKAKYGKNSIELAYLLNNSIINQEEK